MCFSATASFVAGAGLAAVGVATLRCVEQPRDRMLAAVPLGFAVHQAVEGVVWMSAAGSAVQNLSMHAFAMLAYCGWPIWLPLALYFHEPDPERRRRLIPLLAAGVVSAAYFLFWMFEDPLRLRVRHEHLQYRFDYPWIYPSHIAYGLAVMVPPQLSRSLWLKAFGAALFASYLFAYFTWDKTFPSVWCYFAALLSTLIYAELRWGRNAAAGYSEMLDFLPRSG